MTDTWQPLVLVGLGAFHGMNPAMGWLFAVALGLHRRNRTVMFLSLVPIAAGHTASIAAVASLLVVAGYIAAPNIVQAGSGLALLGWAAYHWRFGHRHRVRFGMQTGFWGLGVWAFLMTTAHGAGLMLWPVLMPSCGQAYKDLYDGPIAALAGVGLHSLAMLATTALIASVVYEWLGLALLRRAWLNIDLIWVAALIGTGRLLLLTASIGR